MHINRIVLASAIALVLAACSNDSQKSAQDAAAAANKAAQDAAAATKKAADDAAAAAK